MKKYAVLILKLNYIAQKVKFILNGKRLTTFLI